MRDAKPPLWQVLHTAHNEVGDPFGTAIRAAYAAEIEAFADYFFPEEPPPHRGMRPGGRRCVLSSWRKLNEPGGANEQETRGGL